MTKKTTPHPTGAPLGDEDVLLTRREAAEYLRKSVPTLERWMQMGTGPRYVRVGKSPLYPLQGLREFAGLAAPQADRAGADQ